MKAGDPHLDGSLTLAEFIVAFGVFRNFICVDYPRRREDRDVYLAFI